MPEYESLEMRLQRYRNPVEMLRNSSIGKYIHAGVQSEFSNWIDEQRAWRETAVLFDQSHHMTELTIRGPGALRLLADTGVNSFRNFSVNRAKQFVACNYDGYVIGDVILFYLDPDSFNLVGRASLLNWLEFHAETGGYDVTVDRDERTAVNPGGRRHYRYQVQGPSAPRVLEALNGGPLPELKFFHMGAMTIAGRKVRTLKHGMSGAPGLELFGPAAEGAEVMEAIEAAGQKFGLKRVGSRAYATNTLESGWIPCPVPAVYSGERMKPYREWLPAAWYEGSAASLGGSFYSDDIEDYYSTPYDLGYGSFIRFDHEFIGREALQKIAEKPGRKKVTLAWNGKDVARAIATLFQDGDCAKFIDFPQCNYAALPNDRIMKDGRMVGISTFAGYSFNERSMLSLSMVDVEYSKPGTQVSLIWGEENGGSSKPTVERHAQVEIRAIVSPAPYSRVAREEYREGWRTSG